MGIIIPRPAMRSKERRQIEENHHELTNKYILEGLPRDEASAKAREDMRARIVRKVC